MPSGLSLTTLRHTSAIRYFPSFREETHIFFRFHIVLYQRSVVDSDGTAELDVQDTTRSAKRKNCSRRRAVDRFCDDFDHVVAIFDHYSNGQCFPGNAIRSNYRAASMRRSTIYGPAGQQRRTKTQWRSSLCGKERLPGKCVQDSYKLSGSWGLWFCFTFHLFLHPGTLAKVSRRRSLLRIIPVDGRGHRFDHFHSRKRWPARGPADV